MKIKFKAPDPRAGTVVQMDSSRGQYFVDTGAAVLVNEDDHRTATARAELDKALAELPGENTDPDYVVGAMRAHFKGVFTDADEARAREVVGAAREKAAGEEQARKDEEARLAAEEASRREAEERAVAEAAEKEKAAAEAKAKKKGA